MKTLLRLIAIIAILGIIVYADGVSLPLNHTTTVTGTIPASPDAVFTRIADVANGSTWRPGVKSVTMLPPKPLPDGTQQQQWTEHLAHNQTMTFLATHTEAPHRRDVLLDVPGAAYGGTWTYELSPGQTPNTTTLKITEAGFITPPIYRFVMHHVLGMSYNLDTYLKDITNSFKS
jgi:hypothetical protein